MAAMRRAYFAFGLFAITNKLSVLRMLNLVQNWIMYLFVHNVWNINCKSQLQTWWQCVSLQLCPINFLPSLNIRNLYLNSEFFKTNNARKIMFRSRARQAMYVWRNTEALSFNHCCSGKAISIIPYVRTVIHDRINKHHITLA